MSKPKKLICPYLTPKGLEKCKLWNTYQVFTESPFFPSDFQWVLYFAVILTFYQITGSLKVAPTRYRVTTCINVSHKPFQNSLVYSFGMLIKWVITLEILCFCIGYPCYLATHIWRPKNIWANKRPLIYQWNWFRKYPRQKQKRLSTSIRHRSDAKIPRVFVILDILWAI